ncbi:MAG: hypothetical protein MRZ79_03895 [Bacteroidia bacterium]|nr:hypothetical protein [Bacteroidia bacterium]
MIKNVFSDAFEVFQNREVYLKKVGQNEYPTSTILGQVLLIAIFTFCYGLIMGSYNGLFQALTSGLKLWGLFLLTLLICFPSFYIVQIVLGSKIGIKQLLIILLSGLVMVSTIMLAFGPIVIFFQLTGDNYNFIQLLHVGIMIFAGIFGMNVVLDALKDACMNLEVYPKIGLTVFQVWVVIFAFVGLQLSWNLRPFVGNKEMPFELFRQNTQGNVYSAIFGSIGKLIGVEEGVERVQNKFGMKKESVSSVQSMDSTHIIREDTINE